MNNIEYLEIEDVIDIHDNYILKSLGGLPGIRDRNLLESSVEQIKQEIFGTELYPTIEKKAARLCYSIVKNHPFNDGNKRTALMCVIEFLNINGYELKYGDTDSGDKKFAKLINSVAASEKDESDIETFIEKGIRNIK